MARNEEKAQSMLYRFREAQAAELGLGTRSDRRPRMASACKSLRDCERWRGEILREISRKVSKIQDAGLSDYEVRDLNDDINKLMREKRHWENQIVALGGANYRRNVAMTDDDGREVPGTKGYKYFGRAKELPGVKELFQSRKKEEDEETATQGFYKRFTNQGPAYFGDLDEVDGELLKYEQAAEENEYEEACANLREILGLSADHPLPPLPRANPTLPPSHLPTTNAPPQSDGTKRKAPDPSEDQQPSTDDASKRTKANPSDAAPATDSTVALSKATENGDPTNEEVVRAHATAAAAYISFLQPENLMPPVMPTKEQMEGVLLDLRKRALVDEYFGN
ncbi:pre-mRNA-splicing factor ISY1 [Stereum hirsutum FP-91666 SS1]|uniref:pre-mRNA-splicing factor ISY1 n=1 Tax=Stereum hirsutum (strain FP-91666) TaxID=721885 RepID=UPI000440E440|nr:pre-mRNA-splicing factor ISY1 [Stereum hirsutum FP-91666 SS1]EIM87165.1 pre-mRNA-splicing factor ISY1 [Stereum hirsutum FP-91666 SS1]